MKKPSKLTAPAGVEDFITPAEAARMRGVKPPTITYLMKRGKLTTRQIGGRSFLLRSEVESYVPAKGGRLPKAKPEKQSGRKR
jgi:hypothetical protein